MNTLFLNPETWDLMNDTSGNIALARDPYAQAQDAASAIKLFEGELYYNTALGVPYWDQILGHFPPVALIKLRLQEAALRVPGVVIAVVFVSSFKDRHFTGQVQIRNDAGKDAAANFSPQNVPVPVSPPQILYNEDGLPLRYEHGGYIYVS